jgi:hypothetical protein
LLDIATHARSRVAYRAVASGESNPEPPGLGSHCLVVILRHSQARPLEYLPWRRSHSKFAAQGARCCLELGNKHERRAPHVVRSITGRLLVRLSV